MLAAFPLFVLISVLRAAAEDRKRHGEAYKLIVDEDGWQLKAQIGTAWEDWDKLVWAYYEGSADPEQAELYTELPYGIEPRDQVVLIDLVQVHKSLRGQGTGRQLVELAERWGREAGATAAVLWSTPIEALTLEEFEVQDPEPFYRRLGYRVEHDDPREAPDVLMVKGF